MVRNYIVADVGGTQIRVAVFPTNSQNPTSSKRISTRGPDAPHTRLIDLITSLVPEDEGIEAITVAAPGPLDPYEGIIYQAPNIPEWRNLPLRKLIQDHFNVPVAIGNDANLAALGEWRYGAAIGHHNVVYLTISTGIGGGVIIDDRMLQGAHGLAAELGHVTVMPDGPFCGCGQRGHLEAVSSGPAIARWVKQELSQGIPSTLSLDQPITAKEISLAAVQGDKLAQAAIAQAGTFLGIAIADYLHIFNPDIVLLGGGVSQSGEVFLSYVRKAMSEHVMSKQYLDGLVLTTCALGDDAGLMGALALAQSLEKSIPCP